MFLSHRLWQALNNPPRQHPLFTYVRLGNTGNRPQITAGFFSWGFMCIGLAFIFSFIFPWLAYAIIGGFILLNTICGLRFALQISEAIQREKRSRGFDLLAALPTGSFGSTWAIGTGALHRLSSFRWLPHLMSRLAVAGLLTLGAFCVMALLVLEKSSLSDAARLANTTVLQWGIIGAGGFILLYIDHLYSMLTATLFGMLTSDDRQNAGAILLSQQPPLSFLTAQVISYTIAYAIGGIVIPQLLDIFSLSDTTVTLITITSGIVCFVILRELTVRLLWQQFLMIHHAIRSDVEFMLRPSRTG